MPQPVILVTDDDAAWLQTLEAVLNQRFAKKATVITAVSAGEALNKAKAWPETGQQLALAVCALELGGMRGDQLLAKLHEAYPEAAKLLLATEPTADVLVHAINTAGLNRVLFKPILPEDLANAIDKALQPWFAHLQLQNTRHLLHSLDKALTDLSSELDPKRVLGRFVQHSVDLVQAERGIFLVSKGGKLRIEAFACLLPEASKKFRQRMNTDTAALNEELTELFTDTLQSDETLPSRLICHVQKRGETLGYLYLDMPETGQAFAADASQHLGVLAAHAASALEAANLQQALEDKMQEIRIGEETTESLIQLMEGKDRVILESVQYARKIQNTILRPTRELEAYIPESFVYYAPLEVISGDFYWFAERFQYLMVGAVDCTGHGVPGAFMSLITSNALYKVAEHYSVMGPKRMLNELNLEIGQMLREQSFTEEVQDSVDIAFCSFDQADYTLTFAGARRPLYHIRNGELFDYKANTQSIGNNVNHQAHFSFEEQSINLEPGDVVYIFTDGITDQFNDKGDKFSIKRFKELLLRIHKMPMPEQQEQMIKAIKDWKGREEQTDDILVIGMRF